MSENFLSRIPEEEEEMELCRPNPISTETGHVERGMPSSVLLDSSLIVDLSIDNMFLGNQVFIPQGF